MPQFQRTPNSAALFSTDLRLPNRRQGKVRDIYDLPRPPVPPGSPADDPRLLIIATDRISAFDVVLPTPIPGKGVLLTQISAWWFDFIARRSLAATHMLSADPAAIPDSAFAGAATSRADLAGRSTIARRCRVIPVECVARGYLEGSGLKEYREAGAVSGIALPPGLRQCDRLPEPIFTPATKAPQGEHDQNITFENACDIAGRDLMIDLRRRTLAIYRAAAEHALSRGIIIADTKFEFGLPIDASGAVIGDRPILIDEVLTPDSSRFWPADSYRPGAPQPSFDKQFLREHLQDLCDRGQWNKQAPGPELPPHIVERTLAKYVEAHQRLVG